MYRHLNAQPLKLYGQSACHNAVIDSPLNKDMKVTPLAILKINVISLGDLLYIQIHLFQGLVREVSLYQDMTLLVFNLESVRVKTLGMHSHKLRLTMQHFCFLLQNLGKDEVKWLNVSSL